MFEVPHLLPNRNYVFLPLNSLHVSTWYFQPVFSHLQSIDHLQAMVKLSKEGAIFVVCLLQIVAMCLAAHAYAT